MRWVMIIIGALLILAGGVWALQGVNVLTQGQMAGHLQWTAIGAVVAVFGIVLVVLGARRKARG